MWTQIRLQPNMDLHCLTKDLLKHFSIRQKQTTFVENGALTLKAPITTSADDKFCDIFTNFLTKKGMILHENRLPADDSHEISCLIGYF